METRKILVLTDRFPPFSDGGAEISLHILLQSIIDRHHEYHITVVSLNEKLQEINKYNVSGIDVFQIPHSPQWISPPSSSRIIKKLIRHKGINLLYKAIRALNYLLLDFNPNSMLKRFKRIKLAAWIKYSKKMDFLPMMDDELFSRNSSLKAIKKIAFDLMPDLIHADNFRSIALASRINFGVPVIAHVRDNRFFCTLRSQAMNVDGKICESCSFECTKPFSKKHRNSLVDQMMQDREFRRSALKRTEEIIVTSNFLNGQIKSILPNKKTITVRNPSENSPPMVGGISHASCPPEILIVGMINSNKGQLEIIEWLEKLETNIPDFRIVLAGRGNAVEKKLKNQIKARNQTDRVSFLGYLSRNEIYRAYARATVIACPNKWPEPFGRVPLEAGLLKKPVVAYKAGGIAESVIHNHTGLLVQPGDTNGFIDALLKIIKNPEYATMLGENAYKHISLNYDSDSSTENLCSCWENVIASAKRSINGYA